MIECRFTLKLVRDMIITYSHQILNIQNRIPFELNFDSYLTFDSSQFFELNIPENVFSV